MVDISLIKFDNNGNEELQYVLGNFEGFTYDINTPVTPAPLPEEDSDENVLIKIEGNSSMFKLRWKIHDTDTNREKIAPITVKTVPENILYFKNVFRPVSINDSFALLVDFPVNPIIWFGTVGQIHMSTTGTEPVTLNASTTFLEGTVIALYDIDVPSEPINFSATSTTAGEIDLSWSTPFTEGSSSIVGYRIIFGQLGVSRVNKDVGVVSGDILTGLNSLQTYTVKIAAISNNGVGRFTKEKRVVVV